MSCESKYHRLNEELRTLKKVISKMNSNVVVLNNISAQVEHKTKINNLSEEQVLSIEKKLEKIINKHKNHSNKKHKK